MTSCGLDPDWSNLGRTLARGRPAPCDALPGLQAKPKTSQVFAGLTKGCHGRMPLRTHKNFDGSDGGQAHQDRLERKHLSTAALIEVGNVV